MSPSRLIAAVALSASLLTLNACGTDNPAAPRVVDTPPASAPVVGDSAPCAGARADRKHAYFGDLHTHTAYSLDAYFFNATNDPRAAHRFAKGEDGGLPGMGTDDPYTQQRKVNIGRPLDFNAVTDHAEFLGGFVNTCGRNATLQKQCDERLGKGIRADVVNIAAGNTSLQQQLLQSLIAISRGKIVKLGAAADIMALATKTGLADLITKHPRGLDLQISEGGQALRPGTAIFGEEAHQRFHGRKLGGIDQ